MLQILNFRMRRAFWENFGENFRRERPKTVHSRSRKTRMKPSKTGKPLPKSQLDFECSSLQPLRYASVYKYSLLETNHMISSRSRYDHFDTSPYSNHAVERSANIHTDNPTALLLYQKSRLPSTGFHCRKRGRTQHQHARTIGIGQPVAADLPHKFPPVVEIFAKYYYFKAILYKRLPGLL